jgi:hypothetical protein
MFVKVCLIWSGAQVEIFRLMRQLEASSVYFIAIVGFRPAQPNLRTTETIFEKRVRRFGGHRGEEINLILIY